MNRGLVVWIHHPVPLSAGFALDRMFLNVARATRPGVTKRPLCRRAPGGDSYPGPEPRWMPSGSLRHRAPVQGSAGIAAPTDLRLEGDLRKGGSMVEQYACFAGVDWATETHHVCVVSDGGAKREERTFRHGGAGLAEMAEWIAARSEGAAEDIPVAIEVPHGPVVESLMDRGFAVYSINPKQLDRFRDRFSPAGAKDDSRDARVLADALRTDLHCFRRIDPVDPAVVKLREWSRIAEELTRDRTRLANRVREQLWRYYPQILEAADSVAQAWFLELWARVPTPAKARRIRRKTLDGILKRHRIRRITADQLMKILRAPAIPSRPERPRPRWLTSAAPPSASALSSVNSWRPNGKSSACLSPWTPGMTALDSPAGSAT